MSWSSYPKIWNLGHKAVAGPLLKSVQFGEDEEKLFFVQKQEDGSAVTYDGFGGVSQTVHGDSQAEQGGSG